jgi:hypothetical protein
LIDAVGPVVGFSSGLSFRDGHGWAGSCHEGPGLREERERQRDSEICERERERERERVSMILSQKLASRIDVFHDVTYMMII